MMFNDQFLGETFVIRIVLSLLHSSWQLGLVAAVAYALIQCSRTANVRYAIGVYSLALMTACPCITFYWLSTQASPSRTMHTEMTNDHAVSLANARSRGPEALTPALSIESADVNSTQKQSVSLSASASRTKQSPIGSAIALASPGIFVLYTFGMFVMFSRLMLAWIGTFRLKRSSVPIRSELLLEALAIAAKRVGVRTLPSILHCGRAIVPVVTGIIKPTILLPASMLTSLSVSQLEVILAHELAHVRRLDTVVIAFQRLVEAVLFFHPAVWLISNRINAEREQCCDDLVVRTGWNATVYADALIRVAELCDQPTSPSGLMAAASGGSPSELKRRIMKLLDPESKNLRYGFRGGEVFCLAAMLSIGAMAALWIDRAIASPQKNIGLRMVPVTVVNGDTGKPAKNVRIEFSNDKSVVETLTDEDGRIHLSLEPGKYKVNYLVEYGTPYVSRDSQEDGIEFEVSSRDGQQSTLEIRLEPAATVDIQIVDEVTGLPLEGVDIRYLMNDEQVPREYAWRSYQAPSSVMVDKPRTDSKGKMRVFFKPGLVSIFAGGEAIPKGYYSSARRIQLASGDRKSLTIAMGTTAPFRIELKQLDEEQIRSLSNSVDLQIKDPEKIYIRAIPTNRPMEFMWRVRVPKNFQPGYNVTTEGGGSTGSTVVSPNSSRARDFVLHANLHTNSKFMVFESVASPSSNGISAVASQSLLHSKSRIRLINEPTKIEVKQIGSVIQEEFSIEQEIKLLTIHAKPDDSQEGTQEIFGYSLLPPGSSKLQHSHPAAR